MVPSQNKADLITFLEHVLGFQLEYYCQQNISIPLLDHIAVLARLCYDISCSLVEESSLRVLEIHCSSFSYEVRRSTPVAEEPEPSNEDLKDVLVCFMCFEKKDEDRSNELLEMFVENLKADISRIKCEKILLHPYAHLSKDLGSPKSAKDFFNRLRLRTTEEGIDVHKSPFGWYKAFKLDCIGHPLSEAYREF